MLRIKECYNYVTSFTVEFKLYTFVDKMQLGKVLSDEGKGTILAYEDEGLKYAQISRKIGRSRVVIGSFLKNIDKYGKKYKTGRKPKLSNRDKRIIINEASNSFVSYAQLAGRFSKMVSKMAV